MRNPHLGRTRSAVCLGLLLATPSVLAAQGTASRPEQTNVPAARWDLLFANHDYFALRDEIARWRGGNSPQLQYYRGLLARTFNRPDDAIAFLRPLVGNRSAALGARNALAARALAESYLTLYRYSDAANAYRAAGSGNLLRDSIAELQLQLPAQVAQLIGDVLPQRVSWKRAAILDTLRNAGMRARIVAAINGAGVTHPLQVSISAPFTIIDSSTAASHRVELLTGRVGTLSLTGRRTQARVGLIASLDVGPASVSNVVTLVMSDADLTSADGIHVTGIIGFPVINALGRVALTRDGHIALSSPGAARLDSSPRAPIAFDQAASRNLVPVVEGTANGRRASFTVSFAAANTVLYPSFARTGANAVGGDTASGGPNGDEASTNRRDLDLRIGGDTVRLPDVPIIASGANLETAFHEGNLGADAVGQADALTFDFATMTVGFDRLPPPPVLPGLALPQQVGSGPTTERGPRELAFIALLFGLFIVPKALQRFRLPGAITSLLMGGVARALGFFPDDPTLQLLSTLGIVALFLFAGLEIDGRELRKHVRPLAWHAGIWTALATATAVGAALLFGASPRVAALLALALVTPSTGFILSSLSGFGLTEAEQRTVKTYAIGSELIALTALFFVTQSTSLLRLALASGAMIGLVVLIPLAFRFFATVVAPYAPRSEFAFLLMVAVVCAYTTRRLGVYYLVGAFVVGLAAQRFRADHPAMSSERMVDALESFGSVFIPFYFFHAGTEISPDQLTFSALGIGVLLLAVFVPVRIAVIGFHRRLTLRESFRSSRRIGSALVPTLVFTLVIVEILHDRFALSGTVAGALVLYTILNTMMPGFVLRGEPADFEDVAAAPV